MPEPGEIVSTLHPHLGFLSFYSERPSSTFRSPSARVESTRAKIVNADLFDEPVRIVEPPQAKRKKMTAQLPSGPAIVYMLHDADIAEDIAGIPKSLLELPVDSQFE
eukprot:m.399921 g.399921  ORF g.399921 m.399921 type:complete len:107 (+) comp56437_c0_seq26:1200-1520(+)